MTAPAPKRGLRVRVSHAWRLVATGLAFALFGVGGLLLSLTVFPLLWLLPLGGGRRQRYARRVISHAFHLFVWLLRGLGLLSFELHGVNALKAPNRLIVANHPSLLDVVFLIAFSREANCVVKGSYWRNPFIMLVVRAANYLRNDRADLLEACAAVLEQGESLIIFPEGTRSRPGEPLRMMRGAASIALAAQRPFTPVVISCHPATLLKGQKWYEVSPRPPHYRFRVMPDMPVEADPAPSPEQSVSRRRRLTRELAALFERERLAEVAEPR